MPIKQADMNKIFNNENYLKQTYTDVDIGAKISDSQFAEYRLELINNTPIDIKTTPIKGHPHGNYIVTYRRGRTGRLFKRYTQEIHLEVIQDFEYYFTKYSDLEILLSKFLQGDVTYCNNIGNNKQNQYLYITMLSNSNLDVLPETMYWIHYQFTRDLPRWARFKRLFQSVALNIDPAIISTVKYKMLTYLYSQRSNTNALAIPHEKENIREEYIVENNSPTILHPLLDMLVYMPYCWMFMVYKAMDINGTFALDIMQPKVPEESVQQEQLSMPEDVRAFIAKQYGIDQ